MNGQVYALILVSVESITTRCIRVKTSTCQHEAGVTGKDHHHHHFHHHRYHYISCGVLGLVTFFQSHYEFKNLSRVRPYLRFPTRVIPHNEVQQSVSVSVHSANILCLFMYFLIFFTTRLILSPYKNFSLVFVILQCLGKKVK